MHFLNFLFLIEFFSIFLFIKTEWVSDSIETVIENYERYISSPDIVPDHFINFQGYSYNLTKAIIRLIDNKVRIDNPHFSFLSTSFIISFDFQMNHTYQSNVKTENIILKRHDIIMIYTFDKIHFKRKMDETFEVFFNDYQSPNYDLSAIDLFEYELFKEFKTFEISLSLFFANYLKDYMRNMVRNSPMSENEFNFYDYLSKLDYENKKFPPLYAHKISETMVITQINIKDMKYSHMVNSSGIPKFFNVHISTLVQLSEKPFNTPILVPYEIEFDYVLYEDKKAIDFSKRSIGDIDVTCLIKDQMRNVAFKHWERES